MKTLYIHIGCPKTATTSIQYFCNENKEILSKMRNDYNILLAGSFGCFGGKLIRIGHMGESANEKDVDEVLQALIEILGK